MPDFAKDAETLTEKMLAERRAQVEAILRADRPSLEEMQRLAAIEDMLALATNIRGDETTRAGLERYDESRAAGTLDNRGFERELAPPDL